MEKMVTRLADYLCTENIIRGEEREVYQYYLEVTFSTVGYWVSILIGAVMVDRLWESMVYLGTFMLLRMNFGGYHASTHLKCALLSLASYLLFLLAVMFFPIVWIPHFIVIAMLVVVLSAVRLAPIDHSNKPFSNSEYQKYRKNSIRMVGIIVIGVCMGMIMKQYAILLCVGFGALQASVSLLMVVGNRREGLKNEQN